MKISNCITSVVLIVSLIAALPAAAQTAAEARMRDQLRQTTLDLRAAQDENSELKQKLGTLTQAKPAAPSVAAAPVDTAKSRRNEAALRAESAKTAALQKQLDEARKALEQWQQTYTQTTNLARGRDADAKKFEADSQVLGERVQRCERDNANLAAIGSELLERYKNKSAWSALGDAEPITGLRRVQLEKLAQDYHGRIIDATVAPPPASPQ